MNKTLKTILIIINILILFVAGYWIYTKKNDPEPIAVFLAQIATLFMLFFENSITRKFEAGNLLDSELDIENKDDVKMKDITKSKVKVK
ncbi:hypothetical protein [Chryseobacterium sp. 2987]|uniref:hypothetical protein n=1 Tax=Chryseobacterium sp. 2987 TaxID=2817767 RepID=UPI0028545B82|nr:hypothetical protein [Chryseobacterium sp. 2987]MDR6922069.1 hypothetical protein [Chryseobacterium sp. 2987]